MKLQIITHYHDGDIWIDRQSATATLETTIHDAHEIARNSNPEIVSCISVFEDGIEMTRIINVGEA